MGEYFRALTIIILFKSHLFGWGPLRYRRQTCKKILQHFVNGKSIKISAEEVLRFVNNEVRLPLITSRSLVLCSTLVIPSVLQFNPRCLRSSPRRLTCDKAFCFRWKRSPVSCRYREVWNWLWSQMFQYWRSGGFRACALPPSNHLPVLDVALQRRKFYLAWRNASLTCLCLGAPISARGGAARGVKQWLSHEPNRLLGNIDIIG